MNTALSKDGTVIEYERLGTGQPLIRPRPGRCSLDAYGNIPAAAPAVLNHVLLGSLFLVALWQLALSAVAEKADGTPSG